jgi:tetratricopeptide (TPR) repeat protein
MASRGRSFAKLVWAPLAVVGLCLVVYVADLVLFDRSQHQDLVAQARAAYDREEWQRAAELARRRLKTDEHDPAALRLLARSSIRLGNDRTGLALYNGRLGAIPREPEDAFLIGLSLLREGNEEQALETWSQAVGGGTEHPELCLSLANLLARRQHLDEAAAEAVRLSRMPGWESAGLLLLGTIRMSLEDYPAAADALRRGLEADPEAGRAPLPVAAYRKLLGKSLLFLGRAKEADHWLEPLLENSGTADDLEAHWLASRSAIQQRQLDRARAELSRAGSYRIDQPLLPEPSPYLGQSRCVPCHREICETHARTRHARTFHHGKALLSLPRPDGPVPDPDRSDVTHTFEQQGERLKVITRGDQRLYETIVDYAFGTTDRYLSMVGHGEGKGYHALRVSFFREKDHSGWGRTAGDVGPTDERTSLQGQSITVRDGVVRCLACHVTNPREFRDPLTPGAGPEAADAGIGCERCHGPGANHVVAAEADLPDKAIVAVRAGGGEIVSHQCRDCHIVGDLSEIRKSPADPRWVRSPSATMTFSRCYTETGGALSCLTCHDPHRDSERSPAFYESKCLSCHAGTSRDTAGTRGENRDATTGGVCPVNAASDCLKCHMPKVPMPVLHTSLTDHYIRVHPSAGTGR